MPASHPTPEQIRAKRLALVAEALAYLEATPASQVRAQLAPTSMHAHIKKDPTAVARILRRAQEGTTPLFSGWITARHVMNTRPATPRH